MNEHDFLYVISNDPLMQTWYKESLKYQQEIEYNSILKEFQDVVTIEGKQFRRFRYFHLDGAFDSQIDEPICREDDLLEELDDDENDPVENRFAEHYFMRYSEGTGHPILDTEIDEARKEIKILAMLKVIKEHLPSFLKSFPMTLCDQRIKIDGELLSADDRYYTGVIYSIKPFSNNAYVSFCSPDLNLDVVIFTVEPGQEQKFFQHLKNNGWSNLADEFHAEIEANFNRGGLEVNLKNYWELISNLKNNQILRS